MKNILIYINDSLGELDWISPFVKSEEGKNFNFYIFLNGPGKTHQDKIDILREHGLIEENIHCLNSLSKKDYYFFKLDEFSNRVLGRIKLYSIKLFELFRTFSDFVRFAGSYLINNKKVKFDYIFRDYNLKNSFSLQYYIRLNHKAKIVIFPHAVGLQKEHPDCPREAMRAIHADLWLENSDLSDIAKNTKAYKEVFFASGVPAFDINYNMKSLFDIKIKKVLIITRDCGMAFGFDYEDAYIVFKTLLKELSGMKYEIVIKHHPRDRILQEWRKIQAQYPNIIELEGSLLNINESYSACFTLFSTAPLFLLSRHIPVFEFSPYKNITEYSDRMPMHYKSNSGLLTHDLLSLGLYKRLDDIDNISTYMTKDYLSFLSSSQHQKCKEIFPQGANLKISNKLMGISHEP